MVTHSSNVLVLGYPVYMRDLPSISLGNRLIINTLNGHSYTVAKKDVAFRKALQESDILLPDGVSVVLGAKILGNQRIKKIAGYDLFLYLIDYLNQKGGSCFFLGSKQSTLQKITKRLDLEFPNVEVKTYSPPYKEIFSEKDNAEMCKQVNNFQPDVLFVGMTAPKQEKWIHENKNKLNSRLICSIGAVFDFYAGTSQRPPEWIIRVKLEWLGRLLKEPKRMWKRYLLSTPVFFIDIFLYKMGLLHKKDSSTKG